jgi:TRAP-type C4-dicarboxylate transport system permease large subunit
VILAGLLLVTLALLGAPLFAVIGAGALLGFHRSDIDLSVVAIEFFRIAETPVLLAIPLFTFAGYLLSESLAPQRLVRLSQALLGWMPGGLALVALAACAFFTAFTGASGITIVALGALLVPALRQGGYGVVVLGGIYGGWLAVSEAAAATAFYVLLVEVVLRREIPLRQLPQVMRESMILVVRAAGAAALPSHAALVSDPALRSFGPCYVSCG